MGSFRGLNSGTDSGFGDDAQDLAGIVLVTAEFDAAQTVAASLDDEGGNGRGSAERTARESLAVWPGVSEHLATAQPQGAEGSEEGCAAGKRD